MQPSGYISYRWRQTPLAEEISYFLDAASTSSQPYSYLSRGYPKDKRRQCPTDQSSCTTRLVIQRPHQLPNHCDRDPAYHHGGCAVEKVLAEFGLNLPTFRLYYRNYPNLESGRGGGVFFLWRELFDVTMQPDRTPRHSEGPDNGFAGGGSVYFFLPWLGVAIALLTSLFLCGLPFFFFLYFSI